MDLLRRVKSRCGSGPRGITLIELLICIAVVGLLVTLLLPARRTVGEAARRSQCKNNLKQLGLALLNYDAEFGSLPPAYTVDEDGRPLHSWRTLLLPFLEQQEVYDQIDLSKPWDDPVNEVVAAAIINEYSCPSADIPQTRTLYQAIVSPTSWITIGESPSLLDASAPKQTVVITEVDLPRAVHWMQPVDTDEAFWRAFDESSETAHVGGVQVVLADGSVCFIGGRAEAGERESLLRRAIESSDVPFAE